MCMGMTIKRAIKILKYIVYDYWVHESDEHGYSNLPTAEDEREACKVALDFIEGYEQRLKADMVAMLTDIQLEIAELPAHVVSNKGLIIRMEIAPSAEDVYELIQQKISALRGNEHE